MYWKHLLWLSDVSIVALLYNTRTQNISSNKQSIMDVRYKLKLKLNTSWTCSEFFFQIKTTYNSTSGFCLNGKKTSIIAIHTNAETICFDWLRRTFGYIVCFISSRYVMVDIIEWLKITEYTCAFDLIFARHNLSVIGTSFMTYIVKEIKM